MAVTINRVSATAEPGRLLVNLTTDREGGGSVTLDYSLSPSDTFGLAPTLREMLAQGNYPVQPYVPPPKPAPTPEAINAERDRRLGLGITFAGHPYQTDEISRQRINTSRISAMAAIMGGAQLGDLRWPGVDKDFFWIAADDVRVPMDAQTMVAFGNAVAAREGLLIVAGNDLKQRIAAGEAISNIGDDKLWPAA